MYINSTGYYIPERRVGNDYFAQKNNLPEEWFLKRTGIVSRARASEKETVNYMSIEAVKNAQINLPYNIEEVDLIVSASYTPSDTIGTTAHVIQREFQIPHAKVFSLSAACSSAINAMEIIKSFFDTGISTKALLVCTERNSSYCNDDDSQSGHLWGDASTAFFFSAEQVTEGEPRLVDITSHGLGHIGYGPEAVSLDPKEKGLQMLYGRDVFVQACTYITQSTQDILKKNGYSVPNLSYFIGHQSNWKILTHVCDQLNIDSDKSLTNLRELGNTGCASALLVYAQNQEKFHSDDLICLSVFGGGYSVGTCLLVA